MKISSSLQVLALSTLAFCAGAQAAERYDSGKREYMDRCAVCHGQSGKGDGGMIDILRTAPTDLTTLSRNNGGVFPFEHVYAVITAGRRSRATAAATCRSGARPTAPKPSAPANTTSTCPTTWRCMRGPASSPSSTT